MKILFNTYPIAFNTPGGGEVQLLRYYDYLSKIEKTNVSLFNQWKPCLSEYDIVHFFSLMGGSNQFCGLIKELGIPLFVTSSLWVTEKTLNNYPIHEIGHQLNIADRIVVNSDMEAENLSTFFNIKMDKFITIYNAVSEFYCQDISENIFRNKYNINEKFILNVGNIEPRKNQKRLVEAMKYFPDYKLVLIGHIRDKKYYDDILKISNEQIIYLGDLESESLILKSAYASCDLFILPSILETPGLAALEAAASGAKLVVTQEGSTREYFKNYAVYVDPFSVESIVSGIEKGLNYSGDELKEFIRNNFRWENETLKLNKFYRNFLNTKSEYSK